MTKQYQPNPDDRSDNVEKLQDMVQNTIENIEEAEESMKNASGEDKQRIKEKMPDEMKVLKPSAVKFKMNPKQEKTVINRKNQGNLVFSLSLIDVIK